MVRGARVLLRRLEITLEHTLHVRILLLNPLDVGGMVRRKH